MTTKTEIANLSISHLGIGQTIQNLDTETSQEAKVARRFYDFARRTTLVAINWPFATEFQALGLIEEEPTNEWNYSYRYPSQCLKIRRILSGVRSDTLSSLVPYRIVKDDTFKLIYTDQEEAEAEITKDVETTSFFSPDYTLALSYLLATYIAPSVTRGDPTKMRDKVYALYLEEISRAKSNAFNEEVIEQYGDSDLIRARS